MKQIFTLLFSIAVAFCSAQNIQWQKAWGGTADDMVLSIKPTKDGGFIMGGVTASKDGDVTNAKGKGDLWVVKLKSDNTLDWKKTLGGPNEEQGCNVIETSDGGYLIAGNTSSNSGDVRGYHGGVTDVWGSSGYDIWIVKLSATGTILWQRCLGGSKVDEVVNIKEVANGYLVAGNTNSSDGDVQGQHGDFDIWLVRLNTDGTIGWQKTMGGPGTEKIRDVQVQNGSYLFAGYTTANGGDVSGHHGNTDIWIGRVAEDNSFWQKALGGNNRESDFSNYIRPTSDNGFLVAGYSMSKDGDVAGNTTTQTTWIVKFDDQYNISWQRIIAEGDGVHALRKTNDDGCLLSTTVATVTNGVRTSQIRLFKLSADGSISWSSALSTRPAVIDVTTTGDIVLFGYTNNALVPGYKKGYDAWVAKFNAGGTLKWERAYGGSNNEFLQGLTAVYSGNTFPVNTSLNAPWDSYIPNVVVSDKIFFAISTGSKDGDVTGFHYNSKLGYRFDYWMVKVGESSTPTTLLEKPTATTLAETFKHALYPNPARGFATVSFTAVEDGDAVIEVYSVNGAKIKSEKIRSVQQGSNYNLQLDLSNLSAGSYLYKIKNGKSAGSGKLIRNQ